MSDHSRFAPYKRALQAASQRTGTPLPSLIFSFAILHEITAVVPVVTLFYACRALGAGDTMVNYVKNHDEAAIEEGARGNMFAKASEYLEEGELRATRFAKRYGLWGRDATDSAKRDVASTMAGDMANAAVAYGITKVRCGGFEKKPSLTVIFFLQAMLPLRIAASIYLSPSFSRRAIEPARLLIGDFGRRLRKSK